MYTVKKGRDSVYQWEIIDHEGAPIARFYSRDQAERVAEFFNKQGA